MTQLWTPSLFPRAGAAPGPPLDLEQWSALPEDHEGELVAGRLEEEEVPDAVHELAVSWFVARFRAWLQDTGFVFGSEMRLQVAADTGRKADVVVFLPGRSVPRRGPVSAPPDIVLEVVTPTPRDERRDRVEKMTEYAAWGVPLYWIVDPALGSVEVFQLDAGARYTRVVAATTGRIDEIPGCSGLVVDVDALWQELERLEE